MKKTEIILSEIAEGDPIKVLNILKENKNSKLKYQCSYEDHLFQLKSDKESEVDGPFSYIDDVIEYNKDVNSLFLENNKYESAVDVFNNWETPELETYAGGNFNSKKTVYWGDCFICATGCLDIEDLILKLSEFISSEDEEDEEFRDEGFYWFLDSLDIISDPEEFHVGFEDNDIRVSNINYSVGTELGINNISFYSTNNMVHSDYEFMIEILNQSNEKDMVSKNDEIENITEEPKVNPNMKKSTYDNGNILEEWEVNEKGQRHGLMKRYHENGQLQVEVTWTNGIQDDSEIISYHDDGSKARQVTRVNSSLNGEFFEWHKNGQLKRKSFYEANMIHGVYKTWDNFGNLKNNFFKHKFIDTIDFEKFKPYDKEQRKVEEIEVDWLQDISPIYKKFINKNEITSTLQHTLDNEDEYISVFSPNEEDAKNIIDTVIENNGGFSAFESFDYENWHYCYNGYLFNISYKILIPEKLYVVELNRNPKNKMMYFDNSIVLYGIHKDSKKVNNLIKGLNSIVYNAGEMTSGGGQLFNTSDDSNLIVSYWHKLDKLVEKFKSIIDCYPENAFIEDSLGEDKEIKDFTYENIQEIVNHSLWFITFKTEKFRINLSQGNSSYQMNIYLT